MIGAVEGFFGPEWSWKNRHLFCESLSSYGGNFYIYAPKRDSFLRKNWQQNHPAEIWNELKVLSSKCQKLDVNFGVGLSPFEIHNHWNEATKQLLRKKIQQLEELNIKYLGLFFDDMRGADNLADKQIEILSYVQSLTKIKLLFCPTYYSDDSILDKVFGQRSPDYLEKIASLPQDVEIFWTGNKVTSKTILADELALVAKILKRKPIIWDNFFANDGPKQCKFLKLKPLEGRNQNALASSNGWAFNLMNQSGLSEVVFSASAKVLLQNASPRESLYESARLLGGDIFLNTLKKFEDEFLTVGFDKIEKDTKNTILNSLSDNRFSQDIKDWLESKYLVGDECLTD